VQIAALKPAVIFVAGQSNAANTAELDGNGRAFQTDLPVYNLNFADGKCYRAENPLLGSDGIYQGFALPLASLLIDAKVFRRILIVPISVSGTYIEEWRPGGHYWDRFVKAVSLLKQMGLQPDFVLWHQGEGNSGLLKDNLTAPQIQRDALRLSYIRDFLSIVDGVRTLGVEAPIFAAVATLCGSARTSSEIRAAQLALPDVGWKIYQGPDTDEIDLSYRSPENLCHFSHRGNQLHAQKWFNVILSYLAANLPRPPLTPDVKMQANQSSTLRISPGDHYTLSYSSSRASACTMSYSSAGGHGSFPIPPNTASAVRTGLVGSYRLECRSSTGAESSASVTVDAPGVPMASARVPSFEVSAPPPPPGPPAGSRKNRAEYNNFGKTAAVIPIDSGKATALDGASVLGLTIAPSRPDSRYVGHVMMNGFATQSNDFVVAVFQNGKTAPVAIMKRPVRAGERVTIDETFELAAKTSHQMNLDVRVGLARSGGEVYVNGDRAGRDPSLPIPFIEVREAD
jgi:hypothetical protein